MSKNDDLFKFKDFDGGTWEKHGKNITVKGIYDMIEKCNNDISKMFSLINNCIKEIVLLKEEVNNMDLKAVTPRDSGGGESDQKIVNEMNFTAKIKISNGTVNVEVNDCNDSGNNDDVVVLRDFYWKRSEIACLILGAIEDFKKFMEEKRR